MSRWRAVVRKRQDADWSSPIVLDEMTLTFTISDESNLPHDVVSRVMRDLRLLGYMEVVVLEPIGHAPGIAYHSMASEDLRRGPASGGLTRGEVDSFLESIGYPDSLPSSFEESSGND